MGEKDVVKRWRINRTTLFLCLLSVLVVFIVCGGYYFIPQINLKGDKTVILNYKELYKEEGYKAEIYGKNVTNEVKVIGNVNSNKLGTYKISYEVGDFFKKKVIRTVKVLDISKPTIEISKDKDVYLCPGTKYEKESVKAYDNYDGDITSKVKVKITDTKATYSVEDSSGNEKVVNKNLIYEDKISPTINLNGSKYVYAFLNEEYTDQGVTITDNCSDNLSDVVVENKVDITKVGTYDVNYSVVDESGNSSSETRTVVVSERGKPGTIYLTFDDGPQRGTTDKILDILKEEGVEATFFITNKGPDDLILRMYEEGHTVALHTATHDYATVYASVDSYFNDLNIVNERVKRITGEYSYIIRFPGGSSNTISRRYSQGIMSTLTQEVVNRGYKYYDWNISSGDASGVKMQPEQIKNNVVNNLSKNRINMVLMHDIKGYTRDALRSIIQYGKDNGYTFEKITMNTEMVRQRINN